MNQSLCDRSALHLASTHGSAPVVKELLVNGAQRDRPLGPMGDRYVGLPHVCDICLVVYVFEFARNLLCVCVCVGVWVWCACGCVSVCVCVCVCGGVV